MSVHVCVCVHARAAMLTYTHLKQIEGERSDKNTTDVAAADQYGIVSTLLAPGKSRMLYGLSNAPCDRCTSSSQLLCTSGTI